jgi:hypothetical protein
MDYGDAMQTSGGADVLPHAILSSGLAGVWLASRPGWFIPGDRTPVPNV